VTYSSASSAIKGIEHLDLYALLGVTQDATSEAIRRAYRKGALKSHPDRHPNDQRAAQRFLLLTAARDILLDPAAREAYDLARHSEIRVKSPTSRASSGHGRRIVTLNPSDPLTEQVLAGRAQRSNSPSELNQLWRISSTVVKAAILRNISCPQVLFSEPCVVDHWMLSLEAANRAGCPVAVLEKLAFSFERSVALAVASHPAASQTALGTIVGRHRDLAILSAIAAHQNASGDVLREVGRAVRGPRSVALGSTILAHPACPADVAERIRNRLGPMVA
jgi:hypothetical protein